MLIYVVPIGSRFDQIFSMLRSIRLRAGENEAMDLVFIQTAGSMEERVQHDSC